MGIFEGSVWHKVYEKIYCETSLENLLLQHSNFLIKFFSSVLRGKRKSLVHTYARLRILLVNTGKYEMWITIVPW